MLTRPSRTYRLLTLTMAAACVAFIGALCWWVARHAPPASVEHGQDVTSTSEY